MEVKYAVVNSMGVKMFSDLELRDAQFQCNAMNANGVGHYSVVIDY